MKSYLTYSLHTKAGVDPAGMFMLISDHEQMVQAKDQVLAQCRALLMRVDAEKHIQVDNQQIVDLINLIDDCMYAGGTTPGMGEVDGIGNTPSRATHGDKAEVAL